ncbi:MAG: UDP-N-acetylmuramoyl-tripeptide--D-alanyl-D-alanine ligase [Flavobacteriaceae bacterium]|jgi:UDP-N-acetylmuramoyl-tripeptide--D-alanyl-D-alanine ligase
MKIETLHNYFLESTGVCTDTRRIVEGCLFFALKGDNFNGNKFTQEALDKGARFVIIDEIGYHKNTGETILSSDSLKMLQKLATYHRLFLKLPIIALTGSNGKTTTKELINAVLKQKFKTVATQGNLNNHIGVPLTLLSMTRDTEMGIVEMGANNPNEIDQLSGFVLPDFGYITNFGKAHLEGFGNINGVIKAKTELYRHLKKRDKLVFVNANDPLQIKHSKELNRISFGDIDQDKYIQLLKSTNKLKVKFKNTSIQSNLIGNYNFSNIAAAIAIGDYFGISIKNIKSAIETYIPENNRSQLLEIGTNKIILDAYNANPTSMLAALENFKQAKGENKILFLGDMFELGSEAVNEHQYIASYIEENKIGLTYLIGENFYKIKSNSTHIHKFQSFEELKDQIKENPLVNSLILIKASRGMALERILDFLI